MNEEKNTRTEETYYKFARILTTYTGEPKIYDFLSFIVNDFLKEFKTIKPQNLYISQELFSAICKDATSEEIFMVINKGAKQDLLLQGNEVLYLF